MQLSDTQTAILATAVARPDRLAFPVTLPLKGGAVGNVLKSLVKRGLLDEVPATDDQTVWRCDDAGLPITLRASDAGVLRLSGTTLADGRRLDESRIEPVVSEPTPVRKRGPAQEALLALLRRAEGATIAEMQAATGWQPHSVRGALSGIVAKKLGHKVASTKEERGRVYRIQA
jgi:hypothetical protein